MKKNLKILMISSEAVPFANTGGLADVVGSLPRELVKLGCEVRLILPKYRMVDNALKELKKRPKKILTNFTVNINNRSELANIYNLKMHEKLEFYFIDKKNYFDREGLYGDEYGEYRDNAERFSLFCSASLQLLKKIKWQPDIIHCNDWQTGLVPAYLKTKYNQDEFYQKIKSVFTIHNLAYQGLFASSKINTFGLNVSDYTLDKFEFYHRINLLKAGLVYADFLTTVSPTYAKEIQTLEFGCGLEGALRNLSHKLVGILNGIDYKDWDPKTDKKLKANYSIKNLNGKKENKKYLKKLCGFDKEDKDIPIIGIVSRLADQKGFDILYECIEKVVTLNLKFVVLGVGEKKYHDMWNHLMKIYPNKVKAFLKYDALFAQQIYAGADMFLMPSHFEPCGLGQLISLRYGTVPIVNNVGGLADTIQDFDEQERTGNGFLMTKYSSSELLRIIKRAIILYQNPEVWQIIIENGMKQDFSWKHSAGEYLELYRVIAHG